MSGEGSEEAPCCRVCHGESEPDNQLFFPCKCSGSIKYVHQECLVQWLKVSGKENPKCELCGEPFHFQKVYKNDTPFQIAVLDVALELVPKAWSLLYYAIVTGLAMILWVIVLPLFTNWWVKVCWCFVTSSSGYCLSSLPTFAVTGSVEGFVTFWYFGLVDVCIILATSVVSYEVGHMIYKEYQAVGNAKRIRVLERRLATNIANMQRYEEESLRRERTIFAVSDYESMKYEWDLAKKGMEENIHIEPPSTLGTSGTNSTTAAEPSIEDRFRMVQSLVNDERYCAKVVQRLDVVCELAQQDAPGFAAIRGSYQKLHTDLVSTNKQCAELVNLLPSAINPHHPSYRGHQESSSLAHSEHGGDIYSLSPISSAVAGAAGVASEVSGGEGGEREEEEKVPWFEQDTGLRLEDIEPTMDNLELRVNLLMRRKLQEEAAAGRLLMTQQQQQSTEAATLVAMSSSWNNAERNSSIHEIVQNTAAGYEDQEVEYGADCDVMLAAVASAADSMSHGEYQQVEKGREFNLVERALHSEHEGQVEAEQQALCEQQHRNHSSTRWADSPNDYDADVDDEQSCRDLFQQGYEEGIGEVYGDYGEAEGDGVEHRSDIEEVWNALETIITDIELNSCEVYMYGEDDADNNAFDDEGEVEGMGQQLDRDVSSAAENDSGGAAAQPLLAPLQVEVPPIPPADGALPDRIEEVQVVEGPELPAVVPRPGGVEARNRNQNNNNVHNDPFLNFNTIAVAYLYVIVFVLGALLVPSYLGGVFLAHTSLGSRLTEAVRAHVMEMLSSEENYQALLRFLDYLTFSVEDIEAQEDKAVAAALVLANLHAAVNLMAGYAFYISIPFFLFCVCYLQYATDFATNENMVSLTATVTRQVNNIQDYAHTAAKMAFVGTVQGVVVPALFALLTVKFIDRSLPMYMRYNALDTSANFAVWLILFVFAHLFIVHIRQVTFEARVAIDPKYLVGILPDTPVLGPRQEPLVVAALHEKLRHTSYLQLLKSTLIRVCILLPSFIAAVIVPIRLGHLLCPLAEPLLFRMHFQKQVKVDAQIPVEMILWHILLPFVIEKMRYVSVVQQVVSTFLFVAAPALGLDWLLVAPPAVVREPVNALPPVADAVVAANGEEDATAETVNAAIAPPAVNSGNSSWPLWVRASALIALTMFSLALLSSWVLHAPLVVGRWVMEGLALSPHNDLYNYPIGMLLCWGFCFVVQYIIKDAARNTGAVSTVKATLKWLAVAGKVVGVGALWLGLPPFLLGVLIEALVIVPLRMNPFETSHFPYLQNWALGLIILKAITKCVLSGLFGDIALRTDLEMLLIRGFEQFDAMHAVSTILLPVCVILLDFLLVPHFLARAACVLVPSYLARTLMMRFCYHTYIMIRIAVYVAYRVAVTLVKLHNEVRDSKYLIGTRLTNRGQLA